MFKQGTFYIGTTQTQQGYLTLLDNLKIKLITIFDYLTEEDFGVESHDGYIIVGELKVEIAYKMQLVEAKIITTLVYDNELPYEVELVKGAMNIVDFCEYKHYLIIK